MRKDLLNEIIQLKEERKILEAACGNAEIDRHIFSREEKIMMKTLRNSNQSDEMLRDVERRLWEDEREFRSEHH